MNGLQVLDNYAVFLRACEGIPVLILIIGFTVISLYLKKRPAF